MRFINVLLTYLLTYPLNVCKVCVRMGDVPLLLHVSLLGEPGLYVYSTQLGGHFLLAQASMPYA